MGRQYAPKSVAAALVTIGLLFACAAERPAVVDYLDETTAVTITHSRTPFILSTETSSDTARDFVQMGAIEVNRMGARRYYLWLGISEVIYTKDSGKNPVGFESIIIDAGAEEFQLDLIGWTETAIGAGKPVYEKLFRTTVDAYYEVSLKQIELMADGNGVELRTSDASAREYMPWYRSVAANDDLKAFLATVSQ